MTENYENKDYGTYYIAFLDMLGFKRLVNDESKFGIIMQIFEKVKYSYKIESVINDEQGTQNSSNNETYSITTKIISDSICLYIKADDEKNLLFLLFACSIIQWELANFETPILLRGGVVKGKLYSDGNIIFGPGLTRAYLLEEQNAKFPRIIMTNDILMPFRTPESRFGKTTIDRFFV